MRLHFPYIPLTPATLPEPILRAPMRNALLTLLVAALVLPAAALAARAAPGDGTLSVEGASGLVIVKARGAVIGRVDGGQVVIADLSSGDGNDPVVWGAQFRRQLEPGTFVYRGRNITFRLIGGGFKVTVKGSGISISVVGRGDAFLDGEGAGVFSTSGADCRLAPETCRPLPDVGQRIKIGGFQPPERSAGPGQRPQPGPGEKQPGPSERPPGAERISQVLMP